MIAAIILGVLFVAEKVAERVLGEQSTVAAYDLFLVAALMLIGIDQIVNK